MPFQPKVTTTLPNCLEGSCEADCPTMLGSRQKRMVRAQTKCTTVFSSHYFKIDSSTEKVQVFQIPSSHDRQTDRRIWDEEKEKRQWHIINNVRKKTTCNDMQQVHINTWKDLSVSGSDIQCEYLFIHVSKILKAWQRKHGTAAVFRIRKITFFFCTAPQWIVNKIISMWFRV